MKYLVTCWVFFFSHLQGIQIVTTQSYKNTFFKTTLYPKFYLLSNTSLTSGHYKYIFPQQPTYCIAPPHTHIEMLTAVT